MPFLEKLADIAVSGRHVGDMSATFPAKSKIEAQLPNVDKGFVEVKKRARSKAQMTPAATDIFVVMRSARSCQRSSKSCSIV